MCLLSPRRHLHLILTSQHTLRLQLPHALNSLLLQHSNRRKRTVLVSHTSPQNVILLRAITLTGNLQHSGQWLTEQSKSKFGSQISARLSRHFRTGIYGLATSPTNGSVTGETRLRKTRLSGLNKFFRMFKRGSSQVDSKHVTMSLWVFCTYCVSP